MKSERQQKLARYRKMVDDIKLSNQQRKLIYATERLSEGYAELSEAITKLAEKPDTEPVQISQVDLSPLTEQVANLAKGLNPVIKITPQIKVDAPVVNVATPDDISSRYRRVNSTLGPEGTYHGFVDKDSNWFIQLESEGMNGTARSRYAVGKGSFNENWGKRAKLTYKAFDQVNIP